MVLVDATLSGSAQAGGALSRAPRHPGDIPASPQRRCVVTGEIADKKSLLRFVIAPDGVLTPDLDQILPGRGLYLAPAAEAFRPASVKRAFARGAKRSVTVPDDLMARCDRLLAARCLGLLGMARRAGEAVSGFDQVEAWLRRQQIAILVQAADAALAGRARLRALGRGIPSFESLLAAELARIFGREHVVHVAVAVGGVAVRLAEHLARLGRLRESMGRYGTEKGSEQEEA